MNTTVLWLLAVWFFAFLPLAEAQQAKKVPRIGYLAAASPSVSSSRREAFRQGLHDLGYVDGKNIVIEWRFGEGKRKRWDELAAELVRLKVDVIVTSGPSMTQTRQGSNFHDSDRHGSG